MIRICYHFLTKFYNDLSSLRLLVFNHARVVLFKKMIWDEQEALMLFLYLCSEDYLVKRPLWEWNIICVEREKVMNET